MSGTAEIELARQRLAAARAQSSSASAVFASSEESYNAAQHQLQATKIIYDNAQAMAEVTKKTRFNASTQLDFTMQEVAAAEKCLADVEKKYEVIEVDDNETVMSMNKRQKISMSPTKKNVIAINDNTAGVGLRIITINPGKIGVNISFNDDDDGCTINEILPSCSFANEVAVGEQIVSIDGRPVTKKEDFAIGNDKVRSLGIMSVSKLSDGSSIVNNNTSSRQLASQVCVDGAGMNEVNGIYNLSDQTSGGVPQYYKEGTWGAGHDMTFLICRDINNRWHFTLSDHNHQPGLELYSTSFDTARSMTPPENGWETTELGDAPSPRLTMCI